MVSSAHMFNSYTIFLEGTCISKIFIGMRYVLKIDTITPKVTFFLGGHWSWAIPLL